MIPFVSVAGILMMALFFLWLLVASIYETSVIVPIFQRTIKSEILLCFFVIYLFVGIGWSFVKWWLYIRRKVKNIKVMYEEYRKIQTGINDRAQQAKVQRTGDYESVKIESFQKYVRRDLPEAKRSVSIISVWILYWPFSMIVSLFEDLLKKLVRELVIATRKVYDAISEKILKSAE